ncbi:MAG: hypothetical protein PHI12_04375 [Dehalococcoidales bacterium]|nr:hypothetical protein [Dehalococcoidales bacterium]
MQPTQIIGKGGKKEIWRKKKFVIPLVTAVALTGILAGSVFAQEEEEVNPQPGGTLIERLAEKLGIEQSELEAAFAEVRSEMMDDALNNRLEKLIEQGRLTQQEADQFKEWWQARPEMDLGGFGIHLGDSGGGQPGAAFGPHCPGDRSNPWEANPTS